MFASIPNVEWTRRPSDASPLWAVQTLGRHLSGTEVVLERADAQRIHGRFSLIIDGAILEVDMVRDLPIRIPSAEVVAYAIVPQPIDRSDELRGD